MNSPIKLKHITETIEGVLEAGWSIKDWNMSFKDGKMEVYFSKEANSQ